MQIKDHVLLPFASSIEEADRRLAPRVAHYMKPGTGGYAAIRKSRSAWAWPTAASNAAKMRPGDPM